MGSGCYAISVKVLAMVRRLPLIFGLLASLGAAYACFVYFSATRSSQSTRHIDKTLRIAGSVAGYVPSEACAACHQGVWETYRKTGMGRSFAPVGEAAAIEDYERKNTYYHKASDRYYTMYRKDGKLFQRRHQIGFDGKETNVIV